MCIMYARLKNEVMKFVASRNSQLFFLERALEKAGWNVYKVVVNY